MRLTEHENKSYQLPQSHSPEQAWSSLQPAADAALVVFIRTSLKGTWVSEFPAVLKSIPESISREARTIIMDPCGLCIARENIFREARVYISNHQCKNLKIQMKSTEWSATGSWFMGVSTLASKYAQPSPSNASVSQPQASPTMCGFCGDATDQPMTCILTVFNNVVSVSILKECKPAPIPEPLQIWTWASHGFSTTRRLKKGRVCMSVSEFIWDD